MEATAVKLATDGIDHLRDFLAKNLRDTIVWYCHKPCQYVFISIPDRVVATLRGFRCGRLTLNIEGKAARDRAWRVELTRLWLSVADLIQPFYAEIRTGECPTKSWWWNGIPTATPSAMLIGKPYAALWPDFVSSARPSATGLHHLEHFVEAAADNVESRCPSPPVIIAQPPEPARQTVFDPSKPEDMAAMFEPHKTLTRKSGRSRTPFRKPELATVTQPFAVRQPAAATRPAGSNSRKCGSPSNLPSTYADRRSSGVA